MPLDDANLFGVDDAARMAILTVEDRTKNGLPAESDVERRARERVAARHAMETPADREERERAMDRMIAEDAMHWGREV
jgi:hypothetical protein